MERWQLFREVPWRRLWLFCAAAFFLFSVIGFFNDLMEQGRTPYAIVLTVASFSGLSAVLWIVVPAKLRPSFIVPLVVLQVFANLMLGMLAGRMDRAFALHSVSSEAGVRFAGSAILAVVILSYAFFVSYFRAESRATGLIRAELELAHGIQKTLVPPVALSTAEYEVYGISQPSEKVGGDLVDALLLPNGDMIAYLADIAGHGLSAGILMGMLKTAARTALLDAADVPPCESLSLLLETLNRVLPDVKEPQMYATMTAFRLNADGCAWYAVAASPPVLHWNPVRSEMRLIREEQFPLGLLAVSGFNAQAIRIAPGDLVIAATDGVLEVCDAQQEEFSLSRLERIVTGDGGGLLPALADTILEAARAFGRQTDDQTLLLIRRNQ